MTPIQLQSLKDTILATPAWAVQPMSVGGHMIIRDALNELGSPAFVVWRTNVTIDEIMQNGFDWTRVDNLTIGKARIWDWMTKFNAFNPSKPNIRAGIDATWIGTAADLAVRAVVYTHCKRNSSVVEKLYATGTGSVASPATMGYEGPVTIDEVTQARELA